MFLLLCYRLIVLVDRSGGGRDRPSALLNVNLLCFWLMKESENLQFPPNIRNVVLSSHHIAYSAKKDKNEN